MLHAPGQPYTCLHTFAHTHTTEASPQHSHLLQAHSAWSTVSSPAPGAHQTQWVTLTRPHAGRARGPHPRGRARPHASSFTRAHPTGPSTLHGAGHTRGHPHPPPQVTFTQVTLHPSPSPGSPPPHTPPPALLQRPSEGRTESTPFPPQGEATPFPKSGRGPGTPTKHQATSAQTRDTPSAAPRPDPSRDPRPPSGNGTPARGKTSPREARAARHGLPAGRRWAREPEALTPAARPASSSSSSGGRTSSPSRPSPPSASG